VAVDKEVSALDNLDRDLLFARVCDLRHSHQIEEFWRWLAEQKAYFGSVEVLVNNAGIGGARLGFSL